MAVQSGPIDLELTKKIQRSRPGDRRDEGAPREEAPSSPVLPPANGADEARRK